MFYYCIVLLCYCIVLLLYWPEGLFKMYIKCDEGMRPNIYYVRVCVCVCVCVCGSVYGVRMCE